MSSLIVTNTYLNAQSKIVKKIYSNSAPFKTRRWPDVFNEYEGDPERRFMSYLSLVGFGTLAVRGEGQTPAVDSSREGRLSTFVYTTWALSYKVTKEMIREDAKSIIPRLPGLLRNSSDITKEYISWNVFNFAFNPAVILADGQPLCSSAHPLVGPSATPGVTSYSNYLGRVPFTVETSMLAQNLMQTIPDDKGVPTFRTPRKLIYPPGMHQVAMEVLASGYYPSSDSNAINATAGSFEPQPVEYLTSAANGPYPWFVLAGKGEPGEDAHSNFFSTKWDEQDSFVDENTQSMTHWTEFRAVYGTIDARGTVGSSGG